ncbi:hypothetical protein RFI_12639, partial [Reticulomyxa filosa]
EKAVERRHRRLSSKIGEIDVLLQMRPKAEELVEKGVVKLEELLQMYDVKNDSDDEDEEEERENQQEQEREQKEEEEEEDEKVELDEMKKKKKKKLKKRRHKKDKNTLNKEGPWDISLTRSLLFSTIHEALHKSCKESSLLQYEAQQVVQETVQHLNVLRDHTDNLAIQD